jgi:hypothetical protein
MAQPSNYKKIMRYIAILSLVFFSNTAFAYGTVTVSPTNFTQTSIFTPNFNVTSNDWTNIKAIMFYPNGQATLAYASGDDIGQEMVFYCDGLICPSGTYHMLVIDSTMESLNCVNINYPTPPNIPTYAGCKASAEYAGQDLVLTVGGGISDWVNSASDGFSTTTGFSIAAGVGFVGDNFIKLFMGSGLSVLYNLRYWILALVIIFLIVFFIKRTHNPFGKY